MQRVVHRDMKVDIDGNGFSAIGRLQINQFLQALCREIGVNLHFGKHIAKPQDWRDADWVIGADGVNSVVRQFYERDFAPRMEWLTNKFVWYGTRKAFDCLTLTFRANEHGPWVAHHYRFALDRSTFLVECDAATWQRAGLATMSDEASRATEQNISPIADPFDRAYAAAKEIEFSVPEFYNCSRILYDNLAANRSGKTAILCGERRVTYGELCAAAARVGNGLAAMGLGRGSRVLLLMHDIPEYVAAIFGAMRAGFVPVLINTLSPAERVGFYAQDCGAEAAVISGELASLLSHESLPASRLRHIVFAGAPKDMPNLGLASIHHSQEWIETYSDQLSEANTHRDEMAFWMHSSGSTGRPKGVLHFHHDMPYTHLAHGKGVLGIRESDIVFSPPKNFFAYGFGNSVTFPFSVGATSVLLPGRASGVRNH